MDSRLSVAGVSMSVQSFSARQELTIHDIDELAPPLIQAASSGKSLRFDLSRIERIDTAGVQLLAVMKREAGKSQTELIFDNPSLPVLEMMNFYNLSSLLDGTRQLS